MFSNGTSGVKSKEQRKELKTYLWIPISVIENKQTPASKIPLRDHIVATGMEAKNILHKDFVQELKDVKI